MVFAPLLGFAAQSVTLAWDASSDTNVVGYRVYYGVASRTYTNMVDVGNTTTATITNLADGTTYYFAATAYNGVGLESDYSNESAYTTPGGAGNTAPTLNAITGFSILENAGQQTVNLSGISSGSVSENQTLTVTATSGNTALIPNPTVNYTSPNATGTLTFTPVAYANGTAQITVTVNDGGASNNIITRTFTVTVISVNQAPTLNAISGFAVNEDAPQQTVNLSGIGTGAANESQTLTVTATSGNTAVIPNPTVTYTSPSATGTLAFTPVANASGSALITVTVNDGGASNNIVTRTFTVTVNPVNDAPTLNAITGFTINQNSGQRTVNLSGIGTGAANESQTLNVTASSGNTAVIPNPTVTYTSPNATGTLAFTPVSNASGSALITVTVNDGGASNNIVTRTFTVTVNAAPTITGIAPQSIATNTSTAALAFTVGDAETAASALTVSALSSDTTLMPTNRIVFGGSGSSRTVTLTPALNQSGTAQITLTVSDGSASATTSFQLEVLASPSAPLNFIIVTNGLGAVTPNLNPSQMTMGKTYTVTAVPAAGQEFAGWTGSYNSSNPKLTFLMSSNILLQANFIASPYIPVAGTYNGLFYTEDEVRLGESGAFSMKVTTKGTYTGKLQLGTHKYPFSGKLSLSGHATNVLSNKGLLPTTLALAIGNGSQSDQILGSVSNGTWTASLLGDRAIFNRKTNAAPFAGSYTLAVSGVSNDASLPAGNGYGSIRVDTSGNVRFIGTLADGTRFSQGVPVSKHGVWPVYSPLYSGSGALLSWISFTNLGGSDLAATFNWIKAPNAKSKYYAGGFTNDFPAIGSVYLKPVGSNILDGSSAVVTFCGGNLATFTNLVTLAQNSKVENDSTNALALSFSPATGLFRGRVTDPDSGKAWSFGGAVSQKGNAGYGSLLGTNQCSQVVFAP
ncbi:MAG: Ig-like domain-containing protein [Verrucomicrobiota bacterium]